MSESNSTHPIEETTKALLEALDARSRDIVVRRYGLKSNSPETLESIGREYGITRERVRQIQSQAKKVLSGLQQHLKPLSETFEQTFAEHGGILAEHHAVAIVQQRFQKSDLLSTIIIFYLDLLPPYRYLRRDPHFAPHWRHEGVMSAHAENVIKTAREILKRAGHPMAETELLTKTRAAIGLDAAALPDHVIIAQLTASKSIDRTPFDEWGLSLWAETRPRGVGDKAYAVLRRHQKPEHFTEITRLINEAAFDHKTANPQTVHNELIKDSRFVLVGRGLYGLTEWGYIPGTVADVIEHLLEQAGKPLSRDEVIEKVLAQRQVKKNTILLGLQNGKRFSRTPDARYTLRT